MNNSTTKNDPVMWSALVIFAVAVGHCYSAVVYKYVEMGWFEWLMTISFGALSSVFVVIALKLIKRLIDDIEDENIEMVPGVIVELETCMFQNERFGKASVEVGGEIHSFKLTEADSRELNKGDAVIAYLRVRSRSGTSVEAIEKE